MKGIIIPFSKQLALVALSLSRFSRLRCRMNGNAKVPSCSALPFFFLERSADIAATPLPPPGFTPKKERKNPRRCSFSPFSFQISRLPLFGPFLAHQPRKIEGNSGFFGRFFLFFRVHWTHGSFPLFPPLPQRRVNDDEFFFRAPYLRHPSTSSFSLPHPP